MDDDTEVIEFRITEGQVFDQVLDIRVSPEYEDEIAGLLNEHGVAHDRILEHSAGAELVIIAATALVSSASIKGFWDAVTTFITRHRDSKIVTRDGVELTGYSPREARKLITDARAEQILRDEVWARATSKARPELAELPDDEDGL